VLPWIAVSAHRRPRWWLVPIKPRLNILRASGGLPRPWIREPLRAGSDSLGAIDRRLPSSQACC